MHIALQIADKEGEHEDQIAFSLSLVLLLSYLLCSLAHIHHTADTETKQEAQIAFSLSLLLPLPYMRPLSHTHQISCSSFSLSLFLSLSLSLSHMRSLILSLSCLCPLSNTYQIADTEAQQEAQIAHYKEVFNQMDWKGDGVLDEQVLSKYSNMSIQMCIPINIHIYIYIYIYIYMYRCVYI